MIVDSLRVGQLKFTSKLKLTSVKNRRSTADQAFLRDIAKKLGDYIREKKMSKAAAARALGISRQRLQKYLDKEMLPGANFLCRVSEKWKIQFVYKGNGFASTAFKVPHATKVASEQLKLFDKPQILRNDKWEVRVHRRGPSGLDLAIEIRLVS